MENNLYQILPDGRWRIKFDAHMIGDFGTCETLFNFKHVPKEDHEGQVLRQRGGYSWYATFGIWWAHVMEDFYFHIQGAQAPDLVKPEPPTEGDLIRYATKWWLTDDMDRFALLAPKNYEKFSQGYIGLEFAGKQIKFPVGAVHFAQGYWQYYQSMRDFDNWRVIATESTFGTSGDVIIGQTAKVVVAFQGRPDIVIYNNSKSWIEPVDTKTTSSISSDFIDSWKPNAQLTGYCVAVHELCKQLKIETPEISHCVINGAARDIPAVKPRDGGPPKPRYDRIRISYSSDELLEWQEQMVIRAERLRYAIEHNKFMRRESACHNQYGHPCEYREICNKDLKDRETIIKGGYEWKEAWTPKVA